MRESYDINVLALVKGEERYVFMYDDEHRAECLRRLGRFASNPDLSFTWLDATVLSQKIRQEAEKVTGVVDTRFDDPSSRKKEP
ncbi:hypothetical protein HYZ99_03770 [Candidatus Peregrinibacteria bacterium]|nr:hypothetical protein [Candidatus Peregrinibacteria bacterium]